MSQASSPTHRSKCSSLDQFAEDHEVADQDLVHGPDGLEGVQVVLGRLALEMPGLAGQEGRGGVDQLRAPPQQLGDRMLGQPVHLKAGPERAQLVGDGQVAAGVTEADGRGDVEHPLGPVQRPGPGPPGGRAGRRADGAEAIGEVPDGAVDDDGLPGVRQVPGALQEQQFAAGERGDPLAAGARLAAVLPPVDGQHRAAHPAPGGLGLLAARRRYRSVVVHQLRLRRRSPSPSQRSPRAAWSSAARTAARRRRTRRSLASRAASSAGCPWPSPRRCRAPGRSHRRRARAAAG